jgi:hypothetical protein
MKPVFLVGVFLLFLEFCFALYWLSTGIYILIEGNSDAEIRLFHAFLIIHLVTIPIAVFYAIEQRFHPPKFFLLVPFLIEIFYDVYKLVIIIVHVHVLPIFKTAYNLDYAGIIWTLTMTCLITIWYAYILYYNITEKKRVVKGSEYHVPVHQI